MAVLRRSLGAVEAFGFSLSIIAPTLAMAFTTPLTAQSAGRAAPLAYLIGGIIVTLVGLAILLLAIVILTQVPLSLQPFTPEPEHGWAGIGYGIVFAVLSYAGFEGATTLGEETRNPERSIPKAVMATVIAGTLYYVLVSYVQIVGYGLDHVQTLGRASAPLDVLATRYISGTFAGLLDLAAATSALACAIGSLSAAARMVCALARAGAAPSLAKVDVQHDTPARSIAVTGGVESGLLVPVGSAIRRDELQRQHRYGRHIGSYPGLHRCNRSAGDWRVPLPPSDPVVDRLPRSAAASLAAMEQLVSCACLARKHCGPTLSQPGWRLARR